MNIPRLMTWRQQSPPGEDRRIHVEIDAGTDDCIRLRVEISWICKLTIREKLSKVAVALDATWLDMLTEMTTRILADFASGRGGVESSIAGA